MARLTQKLAALAATTLLATGLAAGGANATVLSYDINWLDTQASPGSTSYGTITLTDGFTFNGKAAIQIQLTLPTAADPANQEYLAFTGGNHMAFGFNLAAAVSNVDITMGLANGAATTSKNVTSTKVTKQSGSFTTKIAGNTGTFSTWFDCSNCSGTSEMLGAGTNGPLQIVVDGTDLTLDSFVPTTFLPGGEKVYFAADILIPPTMETGATGMATCTSGCNTGGGNTDTPEPATMAVLGAGLAALGLARRRRQQG